MTATFRTAANGGGTAGTGSRSVSIAALAGDCLIVFGSFTGVVSATPGMTDDAGGTYTRIFAIPWAATANGLVCFVRTAAVAADATIVITCDAVNNSGELHAIAYTGMLRFGAAAIRSSGTQQNQSGGTPAPVLNQAARTENPTLVALGSDDTTTTPPATHTEILDTSQITPTAALETARLDSGFTGTTLTFGAAVTTLWAAIAIELESPLLLDVPLIASTSQALAPTIDPTLDVPLIASTSQLFALTIDPTLDVPLIASTSQLFAPLLFDPNAPPTGSNTDGVAFDVAGYRRRRHAA